MRASFMTSRRMGESKRRFIASPLDPKYPAQEHHLRAMFGVTGNWPDRGCPVREIQGILVHVLPIDHATRQNGARRSHRCVAACPDCGATVSAGRLAQHDCNARVSRTEAQRRAEFKRTRAWTEMQANLRALVLAYVDAPVDTQDEDDAFNAFCMAASQAMTPDQRDAWDEWSLKATTEEIISQALLILGMQPQAGLDKEGPRNFAPEAPTA